MSLCPLVPRLVVERDVSVLYVVGANSMNATFWRILWKEYRVVRGFWLALAALGVLVQLLFVATTMPGLERVASVYATPLVAAALFVAGCMAAVFAAEREEETLRFLQILPAPAQTVAGGKLAFAATSTLALVGVLMLTATLLAGPRAGLPTFAMLLAVFGVAALECAAWAALFSLLSRRPLVAAVAAIAAASVATHVAIGLANPTPGRVWSLATYRDAWPARLALAVLVALAAAVVSRRWFEGETFGDRVASWWRSDNRQIGAAAAVRASAAPRTASSPVLGRLLWQSWRQSWCVALLLVLLGPPAVGFLAYTNSLISGTSLLPWWIGLSAVLGAVLGALAFLADQEGRQYRFFAERAERPGLVWLARLAFWGTTLMLMSAVIHIAAAYGLIEHPAGEALQAIQAYLQARSDYPGEAARYLEGAMLHIVETSSQLLLVAFSVLVHVGGFCIGQFCSMVIRSGVIAGFVASIGTLFFVVWAAVLLFWDLQGPLVWSLGVIPLSLLLATRLRARSWLLERNQWRTWLWPMGVVYLPALLVIGSIPLLRTEVPGVAGVSPAGFEQRQYEFGEALAAFERDRAAAADEGSQTADLYLRACDLLEAVPPLVEEIGLADPTALPQSEEDQREAQDVERLRSAWVQGQTEALDLALRAASRDTCLLPPGVIHNESRLRQLRSLHLLANASGAELARDGDLAQALDRHLNALRMTGHFLQFQRSAMRLQFSDIPVYNWITCWTHESGQTPQLVQKAIEAIERHSTVAPPLSDSILADYLHLRAILSGEKDPSAGGIGWARTRTRLAYLAHQLPWERKRALLVLDRVYAAQYFATSAVDQAFVRGVTSRILLRNVSHRLPPSSALRTTYFLLELYVRMPDVDTLADYVATEDFYRRALLVRLALTAYRLEQGEYPPALSDLEGTYLSELPRDNLALTDRTFYYHPQGLDGWLHLPSSKTPPIPPGTPLFWSSKEGHAPLGGPAPSSLARVSEAGRPLYSLAQGAALFILPYADANADGDLSQGRPPQDDGVPVVQADSSYGLYGYGGGASISGGYGAGYGAATGYGGYPAAGPSADTDEGEGLSPRYDLPSVE